MHIFDLDGPVKTVDSSDVADCLTTLAMACDVDRNDLSMKFADIYGRARALHLEESHL